MVSGAALSPMVMFEEKKLTKLSDWLMALYNTLYVCSTKLPAELLPSTIMCY